MKLLRTIGLLSLGALLLGLFGLGLGQAQAQTASTNKGDFSVAPGQTTTLNVNVFCIDYGKVFPAGAGIEPNRPADPKLINALQYAVNKGYDQSNPRQVQLAMWYLRDNTYHTNAGETTTVAQEIVNNANTTASGSSLNTLQNAILGNQVKFGVTGLKANAGSDYYGTAILTITNLTNNTLNLTLPFGTTFGAPDPKYQGLIGYATGNSNPAQATSGSTTTAAATTAALGQGGAVNVPATGQGGVANTVNQPDSFVPLVVLLLLAVVTLAGAGLMVSKQNHR